MIFYHLLIQVCELLLVCHTLQVSVKMDLVHTRSKEVIRHKVGNPKIDLAVERCRWFSFFELFDALLKKLEIETDSDILSLS